MAEILSHFSRRNMLVGLAGGAAAIAGTIGSTGSAFAKVLRPRNAALKAAGFDAWSAEVGSHFTVQSGQVLKLVEVRSFDHNGSKPHHVRKQAFLASFETPHADSLPEAIYRVAHPSGGTFEIFLSKTGPDQPARMLAVFA